MSIDPVRQAAGRKGGQAKARNEMSDGLEGRVIEAMRAARLPVTVSEFTSTFPPSTIQTVLDRLEAKGKVRRLNGYDSPHYQLTEPARLEGKEE